MALFLPSSTLGVDLVVMVVAVAGCATGGGAGSCSMERVRGLEGYPGRASGLSMFE